MDSTAFVQLERSLSKGSRLAGVQAEVAPLKKTAADAEARFDTLVAEALKIGQR